MITNERERDRHKQPSNRHMDTERQRKDKYRKRENKRERNRDRERERAEQGCKKGWALWAKLGNFCTSYFFLSSILKFLIFNFFFVFLSEACLFPLLHSAGVHRLRASVSLTYTCNSKRLQGLATGETTPFCNDI